MNTITIQNKFTKLMGKVVEFELVKESHKGSGFDLTKEGLMLVRGNSVHVLDRHDKRIGVVKTNGSDRPGAAIWVDSTLYINENEVDINSIRVLPNEESIIWKLENE